MKITMICRQALVCILGFAFPVATFAQSYVEGEVIVKLKSAPGSSATQQFFGKAQGQNQMALRRSFKEMRLYHFSSKPGKSVEDTIYELSQDPNVEYAEPNYILSKKDLNGFEQTFSAEDIQTLSQSNTNLATNAPIHATEVWSAAKSGVAQPVVAVIDTGLDILHPVFVDSQAIWKNPNEIPGNGIDDDGNGFVDDITGWNFVHNTGYMIDDDGHGTHVSGIILGVGQNIFNSPHPTAKIKIMPLKFLDSNGLGTTANAINAIYYAVNNGAKVLNNSWGGSSYSGALHEAIVYSYQHGVSFVAAAGNNGADNDFSPMYPASYDVPNVISVAATTDQDWLATFSNFGHNSVDIGSPGVFILSTIPGGHYGSSSGTSMAAPFISGVAALMLVEAPQMLGYQIKSIIFTESDTVTQLNHKVATEARVNVQASVLAAKNAVVEGQQPNYSFTNQDRQLASAIAGGGGCGMVSKLYNDMSKGGRGRGPGNGAPGTWYVVIVLGLLAIPLMFLQYLRSKLPENQRKYQRYKIDSEVKVKVGSKELVGSISSISLGGVRLDTDALLDNGSVVAMKITSPDGQDQIEVNGHIVWSESKKAYGVQFDDATETLKEKITRWTKALNPT